VLVAADAVVFRETIPQFFTSTDNCTARLLCSSSLLFETVVVEFVDSFRINWWTVVKIYGVQYERFALATRCSPGLLL